MTEIIKNTFNQFIDRYIEIIEQNGEPGEEYKYIAISTFLQNWDIEAGDFHEMLRKSLGKITNLLYQNSRGFIDKAAKHFPEEVRKMFRNLYDESLDISQRIKTFQNEAENLLPKVREVLGRSNLNTQQDERTISVYLAFRFPDKYTLYKHDYYKNFCEQLNVKQRKTGERFLHLQELASQIIEDGLLENEDLIKIYRHFYPKPDWNDKFLMIQNVLYVVYSNDIKRFNLLDILNKFSKKDLEEYYSFLDEIIEEFDFQEDDEKLVFNVRNNELVFTIGQRYVWNIKKESYKFRTISDQQISNYYENFEGKPVAFLCKLMDISEAFTNRRSIFNSIKKELDRTHISGYAKFNKAEIERMAFDKDFRNEILNQLEPKTSPKIPMETTKTESSKIPLNQILFGAPGTGKTYNSKRIAVEIINGIKARTREEINAEYEDLVSVKQIVFTTFHQSLSYEDFIEGIKPETSEGNVTYEVKDGIFKSLCLNANTNKPINFEKAYEKIQQKLLEREIIELSTPTNSKFSVALNKNGNLNLMTGKKKEKQGVLTKENILKKINGEEMYTGWEGYFLGVINYLKSEFDLNTTNNDTNKNYVLIIDEINRGNISAIFGELITLLEEDKRKGNKEQIEVILPYSKEKFSVPNNVYILGTMNTADRSVEALDTALRRRFSFVEMQPKPEVLDESDYKEVNLKSLLETINLRIELLIDKDHQIGHSYFLNIENLDDLKQTFKDKIIPLLEEYFYGDFGKIGLVLGDRFIFSEEKMNIFHKNFDYETDFLEDKKIYRYTPYNEWNEQTFISIYEDLPDAE